jgi:hypothetical protein
VTLVGLVTVLVALAASAAPARTTLQVTVCGVGSGSTWTRAGHTGREWLVSALDDKNQCKSARQWLTQLSARLTATSGADTQAFRLLGYSCVITKSALLAGCRTGNGGAGSAGVAVVGDPTRNPAATPYANGRTSFPALPASGGGSGGGSGPGGSADGVPMPWGGGVDCNYPTIATSAGWALVLPDGNLIRGTKWWVRGSTGGSEAGCRALRSVWADLTAAAGANRADHDSFEAKSWIDGSWSCVVSHDVAAPGGGSRISSLASGACARVQYPGGGDHPILEQVAVMPYVEETTPGTTTAERVDLYEQARNLRNALDRYGVHAATAAATTAERLDGPPPGGRRAAGSHPLSDNGILVCGSTASEHDPAYRILGANWAHGSEHGSTWQVAVNGGYPCELARGLFLPWLADVLSGGSSPSAAQLSRYGWHCALQRAALVATCHFTASGDPLRAGIGKPVPGNMTIGVRAAWVQGASRETLPNAVRAAG